MRRHIVGIDLGTSFSSLSWLDEEDNVHFLVDRDGEALFPSAIFFSPSGVIVGKEALSLTKEAPERLFVNTKRLLGDTKAVVTVDGVSYSPVDLSAFILRRLKDDFEATNGQIDQGVISVPAYFDSHQRSMTIEAAREAGLRVLDIVNEPVAAALTYILGGESLAYVEIAGEQTILVYDLGGGTFDLSLIRYDRESIRVLAAGGCLKLGGIDWNRRLVENIVTRFNADYDLNLKQDLRAMRDLNECVEESKRQLSDPGTSQVTFSISFKGIRKKIRIARSDFESLTQDLVDRTKDLTEQVIKNSRLHWHRVDQVLPVGGSTRMPMIRRMLDQMCRNFLPRGSPPNYKLSPDLAVAEGAALYATILAGKRKPGHVSSSHLRSKLAQTLPTNVNSRSLGLIVQDSGGRRFNHILIPRNSELPCSVTVAVGTVKPSQKRVKLEIVESDGRNYDDCDVICTCRIENLPAGLPENSIFDVNLCYEANGLLQLIARHRATGLISVVTTRREEVTG